MRFERLFGALGFVGIAALAALTVLSYRDYRERVRPESGAVAAPSARTAGAATKVRAFGANDDSERSEPVVTEPARPARKPTRVTRLIFTAARGDCWLTVRSRSADGKLLYIGTLEQGDSRSFAGSAFWVELGAPAYLDVRLNGKMVTNLPNATATVVFTPAGARAVATA